MFQETMGLGSMILDIHQMSQRKRRTRRKWPTCTGCGRVVPMSKEHTAVLHFIQASGSHDMPAFFWEYQFGQRRLSAGEIGKILTSRPDSTAYHIVWDIRLPRILSSRHSGRGIVRVRFFAPDFLPIPLQVRCAGDFFRRQTGGIPGHDLHAGKGDIHQFGSMILAAFAGAMISRGFVLLYRGG